MESADDTPSVPAAVDRYVHGKVGSAPEERYRRRVRDSHGRGEAAAQRLVREHGTNDPSALADETGATVVADEWSGLESLVMMGTYADGTITVYPEQVRAVAEDVPLPVETILDVVLAHELAHHVLDRPPVERADDRGRLERLVERVRGNAPSRRQSVLTEVAAHAFAATLVDVAPLDHPLEVTERAIESTPTAASAAAPNRE